MKVNGFDFLPCFHNATLLALSLFLNHLFHADTPLRSKPNTDNTPQISAITTCLHSYIVFISYRSEQNGIHPKPSPAQPSPAQLSFISARQGLFF